MKVKHHRIFSAETPGHQLQGPSKQQHLLQFMRQSIAIVLLVCMSASANAYSQNITLSVKNASLKNVFTEIRKQTGYEFLYTSDLLKHARPVDIEVKNANIQAVLDLCYKNQPFSYTMIGKTIVVKPGNNTPPVVAEKETEAPAYIELRGRVVGENGQPVAGASVQVKGNAAKVTSTDENGMFSINADLGVELIISHVSYETKTIKVSKSEFLNISLLPAVSQLDQVTVTGYTDYSRSKSPSATSTVTAKQINEVPMSTVDQILQGRVAGLSVISGSGQPGQSASVVIRGIGSISGTTAPLYIMDGIPIESNYFQTINPEDIQSVTVLKDASAKALYGSRGSNGVIVITTKKGSKGKLQVSYSSQYGISTLTTPTFEMMDAQERLKFEEEVGSEIGRNIGPGWTYSPKNPNYATQSAEWQNRAGFILDSLRNMNTDWRDLFFQNGNFMEQQVSLSSGNENVQVYNSIGYWNRMVL